MADFLPKQSKGDILKGMMRNPEISKTIRDAVSSPVGSTSRIKAKKILSIMQKLHESNSGMGGPGMMYERMAESPQPNYQQVPPENPRGIVIFHKIPKPRIIYGKKPALTIDGKGGPGGWDGKGGPFDTTAFNSLLNNQKSYTPTDTTPVQSTPTIPTSPSQQFQPSWNDSPILRMVTNWGDYWNKVKENQQKLWNPTPVESLQTAKDLKERQTSFNTTPPIVPAASGLYNTIVSNMPKEIKWSNLDENGNPKPGFDAKGYPLPGFDATGNKIEANQTTVPGGETTPEIPTEKPVETTPEGPTPIKYSGIWEKYSGSADAQKLKDAIASQESGGSYSAVNKDSGALGKYQIMPQYWFNAIGLDPKNSADIQAFLNNPQLQDQLYNKIITTLNNTYNGDVDKVLAAYYGGDAAAQAVGTSSGDKPQGDKGQYPSINQYVMQVKAKLGTPGSATPGTQVNADGTPKTYSQSIWDKYNITQLQNKETEIFNEGDALSSARNRYLLQTDAAINGYMDKLMTSEDMSNPANVATASAQLKYLYTLRGNATQSYLGMLNTAIEQNQTDLANIDKMYGTAITAYENELQYPNKITPEQYSLYEKALTDMNNSLSDPSGGASKSGDLAMKLITGSAQSAADSVAALEKISLIEQKPKIESYWGWDGTKTRDHIPNLVDTIRVFASQAPEIQPSNIITAFLQDVLTYADSVTVRQNTTGTNTPSAISPETKKTIVEDAIKEFANLYSVSSEDPVLMNLAYSAINNDLIPKIAEQVSNQILPVSQQLMTAVQTLAPQKSWLGGNKATPTEAQFIDNVKKATGDNATATEVAPMIYKEFLRSMAGQPATATTPAIPAQTREDAVKSLLYLTSSVSTVNTPVSPVQFASRVGDIYANGIYSQYFVAQ